MNLKKFAIRGLIVTAVVVALCMFFSGTLRTITTAKVKLTKPRTGKLEEKTELTGKIAFPVTDGLRVELPEGTNMLVTKVNTRAGYTCEAGEVLVEGRIADYDTAMKTSQEAVNEAQQKLMELDAKNKSLRLRRTDQQYADSYYALMDAQQAELGARVAMNAQLKREGLKLGRDDETPEGVSEELDALIEEWRDCKTALEEAQQGMLDNARLAPDDETWSYITEKHDAEAKIAEQEEKLAELAEVNARVSAIQAPADGYVVELAIKEGDTYEGAVDLMTLTAEGSGPVLRADISSLNRDVAEGSVVVLRSERGGTVETRVIASGTDDEGKKYVDAEITRDVTAAIGSVYSLLEKDVSMSLIYRASQNTTLIPSAAVHGSGDDRYVFTVETETSGLGTSTMVVHKQGVTVLGEADGTTSVEEDLSWYQLAWMEDRPIGDGDAVMEYLN